MQRREATAITRARSMIAALADHPTDHAVDHPDHGREPFTTSDYERALIGLDAVFGTRIPGLPPTLPTGDPHVLYDQARAAITGLGDLGVLDDLQVELILDELHHAFHGTTQ